MTGRTIVITGASDGIGAAAARHLVGAGEDVIVVGRSPDKTRALAKELGAGHHIADFAELGQVRALASSLLEDRPRIDVLINNAGAIMPAYSTTVDGHEKTFQVNHLAPFLLTNLLRERLCADGALVITTASDEAAKGRLDPHDPTLPAGGAAAFKPKQAYADSKLANVMFTSELQRRYGAAGLTAGSFHPGIIASNFASDTTTNWKWVYNTPLRHVVLTSPEKGIRPLLRLLDNPPGESWQPGAFHLKNKPSVPTAQAADADLAALLWERSAALVGLPSSPSSPPAG